MKKYLKYIIPSVIGLICTIIICLAKGIFSKGSNDVFKILTDAFFAPGMVIFAYGILVFCANQGAFTMLSYGTKKFFGLFRKTYTRKVNDTYADYKIAKLENPKPILNLVIVGAIFILISMIFLVGYYKTR